jgi:regulator of sigma E protease
LWRICYTPAMITLLLFLVVLSVLVLIHEAGHYFAARMFGVKADEFGYGLPPRIFGIVRVGKKWKWVSGKDRKEYKNTIWSLNWLPIGGFVRIKGEQGEGGHDADSFHTKPIWQRVIVLAAGVGMNWLLAIVLLSIGLMVGAPAVVEGLPSGAIIEKRQVTIAEVLPDSPAKAAGLEAGDVITSVGGAMPEDVATTQQLIGSYKEKTFVLIVRRGEEERAFDVRPVYIASVDRAAIGVALVDTGTVRYPFFKAIYGGVLLTWEYTKLVTLTFVDLARELVQGRTDTASQVTGPVGIAVTTGQMARQGFVALMQFTAILSINLAVVNFLPIPALDGGRVLFLIFEGIRRKAMNRRVEAWIHNVAFLLLIALILFVTVRDLGRYGGSIWGGLKGLVGM